MAKKSEVVKQPSCTLEDLAKLGPQPLRIGDIVIGQVIPREFSTGSYGFGFTGKAALPLPDNKVAQLQCSVNLTVPYSKNRPEKSDEAA